MTIALDSFWAAAAKERAAGVKARADRPSIRRNSEQAGSLPGARAKLTGVQLSATGEGESARLDFSGYASVTDAPYEMYDFFGPYTEMVAAGAFGKTLAQPELDVPLVLQHQSLRRIARTTNGTLSLAEDAQGLKVDAQLDPSDPDVAYIAPKLRSGLVDEMSFMFRITKGSWSPDFMEYHIEEVDIHRGDVSIVGYGANPATNANLRSLDFLELADLAMLRQIEARTRSRLRALGQRPAMTLEELAR